MAKLIANYEKGKEGKYKVKGSAIFSSYHHFLPSSSSLIFDVTNTSTHKIRFCAVSFTPSATDVIGNANQNSTFVTFIRLGDT